jgi:hypothetical protein
VQVLLAARGALYNVKLGLSSFRSVGYLLNFLATARRPRTRVIRDLGFNRLNPTNGDDINETAPVRVRDHLQGDEPQ